jgi:hypothetical protein
MKQLLLATAAVVGLSSAALAAEPVALSDSQLDNVTAGQSSFTSTAFPVAISSFGAAAAAGAAAAGPVSFAANPLTQSLVVPSATPSAGTP